MGSHKTIAVVFAVAGAIASPSWSQQARIVATSASDSTKVTALRNVVSRTDAPQSKSENAAVSAAVATADAWIQQWDRHHDERTLANAQAALARWWKQARPPAGVLRLRAHIRQSQHHFRDAVADYMQLMQRTPRDEQARFELATLLTTMGRFADAARQCEMLRSYEMQVSASLCDAQVQAMGAKPEATIQSLKDTLGSDSFKSRATASTRAWSATLLAQLYERIDDAPMIKRTYEIAIALAPQDDYARISYSDYLLSQNEPHAVLRLWPEDYTKIADGGLLRVAVAQKLTAIATADAAAALLRTRLREAAAPHAPRDWREAALIALKLDDSPQQALRYALANWNEQREPVDVLLLSHAASRAKNIPAQAQLQQWLIETKFSHPGLTAQSVR